MCARCATPSATNATALSRWRERRRRRTGSCNPCLMNDLALFDSDHPEQLAEWAATVMVTGEIGPGHVRKGRNAGEAGMCNTPVEGRVAAGECGALQQGAMRLESVECIVDGGDAVDVDGPQQAGRLEVW